MNICNFFVTTLLICSKTMFYVKFYERLKTHRLFRDISIILVHSSEFFLQNNRQLFL